MATKAEAFRSRAIRTAHPPRDPAPARPRRDFPVDTSQPGTSATDRKASTTQGSFNFSERVGDKGGAALEAVGPDGQRSRKSTRASSGGVKRGVNLQRRVLRATTAPKSRATRAKARAK